MRRARDGRVVVGGGALRHQGSLNLSNKNSKNFMIRGDMPRQPTALTVMKKNINYQRMKIRENSDIE